jgi:hypothetical protein
MVAKQVERQFTQIVQKPVTEERLVTYTETVPETIEREVQVPVTVMVAKEITVRADEAKLQR